MILTYETTDKRYALSSKPLNYAFSTSGLLDLDRLTKQDRAETNVVTTCALATVMAAAMDQEDVSPCTALRKNYCLMLNGDIYIRDGSYVKLEDYIRDADRACLAYALTQAATQASIREAAAQLGKAL